ncbi:MAG: DUF4386 domain-containing protein [Candidatus Hermodarchaeota archaeon]
MSIVIKLSGFLFLLILVLQIIMAAFGYILEPTPKHYDSDAKLVGFNKSPSRFRIGVVFALIEHVCVVTIAITLFIAYSPYNLVLGIILVIFRVIEGLIQVYVEKDYWGLLDLAKKYSGSSGTEKDSFFDSYCSILKTKTTRFAYAMICWSIGTFAFSIVLITYGLAPIWIGWIGVVASIIIGFSNALKILKPDIKIYETISSMGGLVAIAFELLIGGWLLFFA